MGEIKIQEPVNYSVSREVALIRASDTLARMPMRRALAAKKGIELLRKANHQNFSIVDVIDLSKADEITAIKEPSESLVLRRRILGEAHLDVQGRSKAQGEASIKASDILAEYKPEDNGNIRLSLSDITQILGDELGIVTLPAAYGLDRSDLASFYTNKRHIGDMTKRKGTVRLGGYTLTIAQAKEIDFHRKIDLIGDDLIDGIGTIAKVVDHRDRYANTVDFMLSLGILDHLKTHSATLFHRLTLGERDDRLLSKDLEYQQQKRTALNLMENFTRMYYQTMLGLDYDSSFDVGKLHTDIGSLTSYLDSIMTAQLGYDDGSADYSKNKMKMNMSFKVPEATNSLTIVLGAQEAVKHNPDIDLLVGIPSGGTESAIVLQLMYELLKDRSLPIIYLPISLHSFAPTRTVEEWAVYVERLKSITPRNKNILIADDNSSSGKTLQIASEVFYLCGAKSIAAHIVDVDVRRFIKADTKTPDYFDPTTSKSTVGVLSINGAGDYSRVKKFIQTHEASRQGLSLYGQAKKPHAR